MNYCDNNDYELIYLIKEDNETAWNLMIKKYEGLIKKIASQYYNLSKGLKIEYEDLVQEGRIGLCAAIKGFKVDKNVLFYSFAFLCIKREILSYITQQTSQKHSLLLKASSLQEEILDKGIVYEDPLSLMEDNYLTNKIIDFKHSLNFLEASIFELRYNSFSYRQIADLLEIDCKTVDNRLLKIRKEFKKYLFYLQ